MKLKDKVIQAYTLGQKAAERDQPCWVEDPQLIELISDTPFCYGSLSIVSAFRKGYQTAKETQIAS